MAAFLDLLRRMRGDPRWTGGLLLVNLVAIVGGYYYYWHAGQFHPGHIHFQPPWFWPFVADSPNAVVLTSVALAGWHFGLRSRALDALAFVHMVYVGLWTTYFFLLYPDQLGTFDWASVADGKTNPVLFVSHMGMPLEALLLLPHILERPVPLWSIGAMAAWGGLNLWLDYGPLDLRPAPFITTGPELGYGAAVLMALAVGLWAWAAWPKAPPGS